MANMTWPKLFYNCFCYDIRSQLRNLVIMRDRVILGIFKYSMMIISNFIKILHNYNWILSQVKRLKMNAMTDEDKNLEMELNR